MEGAYELALDHPMADNQRPTWLGVALIHRSEPLELAKDLAEHLAAEGGDAFAVGTFAPRRRHMLPLETRQRAVPREVFGFGRRGLGEVRDEFGPGEGNDERIDGVVPVVGTVFHRRHAVERFILGGLVTFFDAAA
jgi:hypothetical protein